MKLKTLKELKRCPKCPREEKCVQMHDLRTEAVKHIKELEKPIDVTKHKYVLRRLMNDGANEWIRHFFNIKKGDLE